MIDMTEKNEERLKWLTNQAQNSTLRWLVIGLSLAIGMVNLLDKPKAISNFTIYQLIASLIMLCYLRILSKMGDILSWREDLHALGMPSAPSEDDELSKYMDRTINFLNKNNIIKICTIIVFLIIADLVYGIKFL